MSIINTGQLLVRGVWQRNGVDTVQVAGRVDVLGIGASGTISLQGVGWQFSGLVLSAKINTNVIEITAYNSQARQILGVSITAPLHGTCHLLGSIYRLDPSAPDYKGALLRAVPGCDWDSGRAGYCTLSVYSKTPAG